MLAALPAVVILAWGCTADRSAPPWIWKAAAALDFTAGIRRVNVSHNSPEAIRRELLDPATLRLIAKSSGLSDRELNPNTNYD
jgi:hypothetical protein